MNEKHQEAKICSIGGQAVMEGVMMKAPTGIAMAVRCADGTIATEYTAYESKIKKGSFSAWPVIRGVITFSESITLGMRTITRSAEIYGEDEEEPGKFELWLAKTLGKSVDKVVIGLAVVLAIALSIGIFFMLPTFLSGLLLRNFAGTNAWKSLVEGLVRLFIFFAYLLLIGCMKDARRLFMYHGAEHKTIACYEHGAELTPENAKGYSRLHPRCGTNYMFLVMAVSIAFFAVVGYNANFWIRLGTRLLFLPVVAGLSYEVLRFGGKSESLPARIVRAPGMALQNITTKEPDEGMLEIAIKAFQMALYHTDEKEAEGEPAAEGGEGVSSEQADAAPEADADAAGVGEATNPL